MTERYIDRSATSELAGPKPGGALIHQRAYEIGSYFEDDEHCRLIGHIRDVKPDGMWGIGDTEPMTIHHMELHIVFHAPTTVITEIFTHMHITPHAECQFIKASYQQLVGLSIARGFTSKVKELFGGPRGCTHIGALTNAMAPVAIQSLWAFFHRDHDASTFTSSSSETPEEVQARREAATAMREREFKRNLNTCHVWAEDGPMFGLLGQGRAVPIPLWGQKRLQERGVDPALWATQESGT